MTLSFALNENDFLECRLFMVSQDEFIKRRRNKSWIIWALTFFLLSLIFYQTDDMFLLYYFLICGILWLALGSSYHKWKYKRYYSKLIHETHQNRMGQIINLNITDEFIETIDITGESKINNNEIDSIIETGKYFYLKLKT